MNETSELVFIMLLNSFPSGGTITRAACGRMIRRIASAERMPERLRRLHLAPVDRVDAGADDLPHVCALVDAEREDAGERGTVEADQPADLFGMSVNPKSRLVPK